MTTHWAHPDTGTIYKCDDAVITPASRFACAEHGLDISADLLDRVTDNFIDSLHSQGATTDGWPRC